MKKTTYTLEELQNIMNANGGSLDLRGTGITALPDNLTVGGSLYLEGTGITALPDNLTVGGSLDLEGTGITDTRNVKRLEAGQYRKNEWLYTDGILTHIKRKKKIGNYTYFVGKIPNRNVIFDGEYYAHCKDFKSGVADLTFKRMKNRGEEQFKDLTLESVVSKDTAIAMYRIITGACQAGTEQFLSSIKEFKAEYTVAEIIEITNGQYGSGTFKAFFEKKG